MRRILPILLLFVLIAAPALAAGENLLVNGGVDEVGASGHPTGWYRDMWFTDASVSALTVEDGGLDGNSLRVTSMSVNDARWAQDVTVKPNACYRITAMVRAEDIGEDGLGANLSVKGVNVYSDMIYDTAGDWMELSLTGRTGPEQTALTVFARIGGYGDENLNTGTAWFDDLELVELDDAEIGDLAYNFYAGTGGEDGGWGEAEAVEEEPARHTEALLLLTAGYVLVVIAFARKARSPLEAGPRRGRCLLAGILGLALLARLILAAKMRGYNTDIACFEAWSERMAAVGPLNFYADGYFCDYPPGYMLLLAPVAFLRALLGVAVDSTAHVVLLKLLPIFCDLAGALLIYRFCEKRLGGRAAMLLCAFYAFNPAVMVDSAAWGQIDAVLTLALVICALRMFDGHYISSLAAFSVAVLMKPQALLFAPLGLAAIMVRLVRAYRSGRRGPDADFDGKAADAAFEPGAANAPFAVAPENADLAAGRPPVDDEVRARAFVSEFLRALAGMGVAVAILYLASLPFCYREIDGVFSALIAPFEWLWAKLFGATQGYRYMTVNTLNLYAVLGYNWKQFAQAGVWPYIAWALFVFSYLYSILLLSLSRSGKKIFLTGALLIVLICNFGPMMHERYVFPALILLLLAYAECRDRRLLISTLVLTATLFMNEALVLQGGMTELNYGHLSAGEEWLNTSLSVLNVLNAAYLAWVSFDICVRRRIRPLPAPEPRPVPEPAKDYRLGLRRLDALLMAAVTLSYGVVAFVNLGDTRAPQTEWVSAAAGEQVIFDLGQERDFILTYYGGISNTAFTVEFSSDGLDWSEPVAAAYSQGEIFRWLWLDETGATDHARFVRLSADAAGLRLREVGFLDENGAPYPVLSVTREAYAPGAEAGMDPALLIDEQEVVPAHPSYLNSTYFDEIYHARTAYEQLHYEEFSSAYEWTHPPLGKALMMLGIRLFGMTPFGWRFMGALAGVVMLPVLYLMVKQLTKRTDLSFIAMFLFAVDAMHFTQTRIATIDSYAVLFIMVMYLFMFRYSQILWRRDGFARSLIPLGLSGLFMGIAWATKWIGIYGSAGLVAIFFWTVWKNFRDWKRPRAEGAAAESARGSLRPLRAGEGASLGAPGAAPGFIARRGRGAEPPAAPGLSARGCAAVFALLWAGLLLCLAACAALVLDHAGLLALGMSLPVRALRLLARVWVWALAAGVCTTIAGLILLLYCDRAGLWKRLALLSLFCVLMFIVAPLLIYYFSYFWQLRVSGDFNLARVVNLQKEIFSYHAGLGGDTHYFRSDWYQWPVIAWPMWYYSGTGYMPEGVISSISCMGNPAVWWFGLAAILFVAVRAAWARRAPRNGLLVLTAFLSQYLPWVLVPRSTFIYHYFASVPFIIIASVLLLNHVRRRGRQGYIALAGILCAAALMLFIAFYPLESGMPVSRAYASLLRWFNWYNF